MDRLAHHAPASPGPAGRWHLLAAVGLLLAGAAAHLVYLLNHCPLDLSGDEAHYWEWARRLDLSYYSKGPLVAYIIALGRLLLAKWSEHMVGHEALAVRVPALVLSVATGLGIYTLAAATLRSSRLALAAVAVTCTIPIFAVGAILMTIDAPLACLFVWTLVAVERGLRTGHRGPWLIAGLMIALGILAKYTMVLIFPMVGLTLLCVPRYRAVLRRPGPYVATLIGGLGFVPILLWNSRHNWVSFRHVAGQAGVAGGPAIEWLGPLSYVTGQAAVVGPIWFVATLCAVVALWRRPGAEPGELLEPAATRFLICATVTPWLVFLAFSPITKIQPNWPVLALLPGTVLLVAWLARLLRQPATRSTGRVLIVAGVLLGAGSVAVMHYSHWLTPAFAWLARREPPWNLTPVAKYDPTARLRGWSQLAAAVDEVLATERAAGREPFIVTDDYQTASEIAFYCPGEPAVYCLQAVLGNRQSQYDIWPNPIRNAAQFIGRPCIYVGTLKPELIGQGASAHVALRGARLATTVEHRVRGHLYRVWPVYVCEEFAGLPPELGRPAEEY
ncbi:MAG: glycosyltransferase family 39 protein [Phycisphaerae bacterium]|nr:glycosyltransferase family 39 protein [Phycisphaerae bacterium]